MKGVKVVNSIHPGDKITLDGGTGRVWVGVEVPRVGGVVPAEAQQIVHWARDLYKGAVAYDVDAALTVPTSGRHYLSVRGLSHKAQFVGLLKALKEGTTLSGVLGFSGSAGITEHPSDAEYLKFFEGDVGGSVSDGILRLFVSALKQKSVPTKTKARWSVHLPEGTSMELLSELEEAGWSVVRPVTTLSELLKATGWVSVDEKFRERVKAEGTEVSELLALLERTGRKVREFGKVVSEADFLQEALGK